jgi:hypothetical protein
METIGYEQSFLVLNQSGIIALNDGFVIDFSYNDSIWDMSRGSKCGALVAPNTLM